MKDALQTLLDGGMCSDKVRGICDDIVECDNDERWDVLLAWRLMQPVRITSRIRFGRSMPISSVV